MIERIELPKSKPQSAPVSSSKTTVKTAGTPAAVNSAVRPMVSLTAAAGLPSDKLSNSIITFARFFSLPLKPDILTAVRRQVFMQNKQTVPLSQNQASTAQMTLPFAAPNQTGAAETSEQSTVLKIREALALAAAAAEAKGVELNSKGLETYAQAVDPDSRRRHDEENKREKQNKNQSEQEETSSSKEKIITSCKLKKMANEYSEKMPLIDILNRLPGKNGSRWIVLPFSFCQGEKEFRVSMRILLEHSVRIEKMVLQLTEDGKHEKTQVFLIEFAGDQLMRLTVYLRDSPQPNDKKKFVKGLSEIMAVPVEKISVKTSSDNFPFEGEDQSSSIDEAV